MRRLAAKIRMLGNWLVVSQVLPVKPGGGAEVRGHEGARRRCSRRPRPAGFLEEIDTARARASATGESGPRSGARSRATIQQPVSAPTVKQHLAAIRVLCDWLVIHQVLPVNPAAAVRGPKHVVTKGANATGKAGGVPARG